MARTAGQTEAKSAATRRVLKHHHPGKPQKRSRPRRKRRSSPAEPAKVAARASAASGQGTARHGRSRPGLHDAPRAGDLTLHPNNTIVMPALCWASTNFGLATFKDVDGRAFARRAEAESRSREAGSRRRDKPGHDEFVGRLGIYSEASGWSRAVSAGLSETDSPQPQALVWFGLLNTKPERMRSVR